MEFDLDTIDAGTRIERSAIERALEFTEESDPKRFQFMLMQLQGDLAKQLEDDGRILTVVVRRSGLEVLTHEQASQYNTAKFSNAIGKMKRCQKRLLAVKVDDFDSEALKYHEKAIVSQSRVLQAIKTAKRSGGHDVESHVRNSPVRLVAVKTSQGEAVKG